MWPVNNPLDNPWSFQSHHLCTMRLEIICSIIKATTNRVRDSHPDIQMIHFPEVLLSALCFMLFILG